MGRRPLGVLALMIVVLFAFAPTAGAATAATSSPTATTASATPTPTATAKPRASLLSIERQVMCVTCKIPLNVAESEQATREKVYIQGLINQGQTTAQIKRALVAQYGPAVLALPSDHGFDIAAYLVPIVVVGGVLLLLALMLPRWRRRTRRGEQETTPPVALSATDAGRLERDLARHDL